MSLIGSAAPPFIDYNPMSPWMILAGSVPVFVALVFAWQSEKPVLDFFQPEMIGVYGWWISLVNGYIAAFALPFLGVLPKPDPAPASPVVLNIPVNVLAVGIIVGTALFFAWFLFRPGGLAERADRIYLPHRRAALLLLLAVLVVVIFLLGGTDWGYALLPSVWFWIHILPRADRGGKLLNTVLALGGMVYPLTVGSLALWLGSWWRLVLAAAYGRLNPLEVVLFLFWAALFMRFLRLGLSRPYVAPAGPEDPLQALLKSR